MTDDESASVLTHSGPLPAPTTLSSTQLDERVLPTIVERVVGPGEPYLANHVEIVVLSGETGKGKTWVAQRLFDRLAASDKHWRGRFAPPWPPAAVEDVRTQRKAAIPPSTCRPAASEVQRGAFPNFSWIGLTNDGPARFAALESVTAQLEDFNECLDHATGMGMTAFRAAAAKGASTGADESVRDALPIPVKVIVGAVEAFASARTEFRRDHALRRFDEALKSYRSRTQKLMSSVPGFTQVILLDDAQSAVISALAVCERLLGFVRVGEGSTLQPERVLLPPTILILTTWLDRTQGDYDTSQLKLWLTELQRARGEQGRTSLYLVRNWNGPELDRLLHKAEDRLGDQLTGFTSHLTRDDPSTGVEANPLVIVEGAARLGLGKALSKFSLPISEQQILALPTEPDHHLTEILADLHKDNPDAADLLAHLAPLGGTVPREILHALVPDGEDALLASLHSHRIFLPLAPSPDFAPHEFASVDFANHLKHRHPGPPSEALLEAVAEFIRWVIDDRDSWPLASPWALLLRFSSTAEVREALKPLHSILAAGRANGWDPADFADLYAVTRFWTGQHSGLPEADEPDSLIPWLCWSATQGRTGMKERLLARNDQDQWPYVAPVGAHLDVQTQLLAETRGLDEAIAWSERFVELSLSSVAVHALLLHRRDKAEAVSWLLPYADLSERLSLLYAGWLRKQDPDAASQWLAPRAAQTEQLTLLYAKWLFARDPEAATGWLEPLVEDSPGLTLTYAQWAGKLHREQALEWLEPKVEQSEQLILLYAQWLADDDRNLALSWLESRAELSVPLTVQYATWLAKEDRDAAREWLEPRAERSEALVVLYARWLHDRDPHAALAWLDARSGRGESTAMLYAEWLFDEDYEAGLSWVAQRAHDSLGFKNFYAERLAQTDPEAALAWLEPYARESENLTVLFARLLRSRDDADAEEWLRPYADDGAAQKLLYAKLLLKRDANEGMRWLVLRADDGAQLCALYAESLRRQDPETAVVWMNATPERIRRTVSVRLRIAYDGGGLTAAERFIANEPAPTRYTLRQALNHHKTYMTRQWIVDGDIHPGDQARGLVIRRIGPVRSLIQVDTAVGLMTTKADSQVKDGDRVPVRITRVDAETGQFWAVLMVPNRAARPHRQRVGRHLGRRDDEGPGRQRPGPSCES